jgi:hypothetical protein
MRHNFYDQLNAVKRDPTHVLPEDINAPVIKFLEGINCIPAVEELLMYQKNVQYGKIEIVHEDAPGSKIEIPVECGMACKYTKFTFKKVGKWSVYTTKTIINYNIKRKRDCSDV